MNDEHRIIGIDIASGEDQTVTSFRCTGGISHTVGDMCPYCQLADTTQHAAELEASLSDHQRQLAAETMRAGEYQQERDQALDLATEMRKRADSLSKNYGRVVGELNSALADRDRLREAMPTVPHPGGRLVIVVAHYEDGSTHTIDGEVVTAALNATGEAAIDEAQPAKEQRTDSLPCPQCNHAFCDCGEVDQA